MIIVFYKVLIEFLFIDGKQRHAYLCTWYFESFLYLNAIFTDHELHHDELSHILKEKRER